MTKREINIINSYKNSKLYSLSHCYKSASYYKHQAFNRILEEMFLNNGFDLRILSYNSSFFSCAYRVTDGERTYLVYHTHTQKQTILYE